jgi:hypothetical protein
MATEIFCWGYTGWRSQRRAGYEVSGFIDGYEFYAVKKTADAAERAFCRAARRAWMRRKVRVAWGLRPKLALGSLVAILLAFRQANITTRGCTANRRAGRHEPPGRSRQHPWFFAFG